MCTGSPGLSEPGDNPEAAAHYLAGVRAYREGDLDLAIAELRKALALKPDSADTKDRLLDALLANYDEPTSKKPDQPASQLTARAPALPQPEDFADLKDEIAFRFRSPDNWQGMRFVFCPRPRGLQSYGYQLIYRSPGESVGYASYVGRMVTITGVDYKTIKDTGGVYHLTLRMDDSGERLTGEAYDVKGHYGQLMDLAPADEIEQAKRRFTGKTLYYRGSGRIQTYDEQSGTESGFVVPRYSPLTVSNVCAGWGMLLGSVRFVVKTPDGRSGYVDVTMSGTNTFILPRELDEESYPYLFKCTFLDRDIRKAHADWPPEIWQAIEKYSVVAGMTPEQVGYSLRPPDSIRRTESTERWEYSRGRFIEYENGKVVRFSY